MRRTETSTLAFLDVMACGLGAVILILVVLKQQAPVEIPKQETEQVVKTDKMKVDVEQLQKSLITLKNQIETGQNESREKSQILSRLNTQISKEKSILRAAKKNVDSFDKLIENANEELLKMSKLPPLSAVDTKTLTQPKYLVGLKVKGSKIVILLDRSASMAARELVQIVKLKAGPEATRRNAEKWKNSLNAVWWLVARAPSKSSLKIASFSSNVSFHSENWVAALDSSTLSTIQTAMESLAPEGGTNLELALEAAIKTGADNIYIITDGLPTAAPGGTSIFGLDGCGSKFKKSNRVTGKCRVSLFQRATAIAAGKSVGISVVLMPLEGDPDAAPLFSKWVLSKGGVLLSVAKDWP